MEVWYYRTSGGIHLTLIVRLKLMQLHPARSAPPKPLGHLLQFRVNVKPLLSPSAQAVRSKTKTPPCYEKPPADPKVFVQAGGGQLHYFWGGAGRASDRVYAALSCWFQFSSNLGKSISTANYASLFPIPQGNAVLN